MYRLVTDSDALIVAPWSTGTRKGSEAVRIALRVIRGMLSKCHVNLTFKRQRLYGDLRRFWAVLDAFGPIFTNIGRKIAKMSDLQKTRAAGTFRRSEEWGSTSLSQDRRDFRAPIPFDSITTLRSQRSTFGARDQRERCTLSHDDHRR